MRIKQDFPTYNASIYMGTKSSNRGRKRGLNEENIREFMIYAVNSVRIALDAGNFDGALHHCLHRIP
jgi:hypothetical protein